MSDPEEPSTAPTDAMWQGMRLFESLDRIKRAIQGAHTLDQLMSDVLEAMLGIFSCDRAWLVYPCDPDAPSFCVPMEVNVPEYPGGHVLGVQLPIDPEMAGVMRLLRESGGPVTFGPGAGRAVPFRVAEGFSVKSFIAMELRPQGDRPYMFGLHQCSRERVWTKWEERLFRETGLRLADGLTALIAQGKAKRVEDSLALFRALLDRSRDCIEIIDPLSARILDVNETACRAHGYTRDEYLKLTVPDVEVGFEHVRTMDRWRRHIESLRKGEFRLAEGLHRRKDGSTFPVEVSAVHVTLDRDYILSIVRDVSDRKRAESEHHRLEEQFLQAQKMEAVGQLAGGVAHDFNNLLTVIQMQASSLLDNPRLDPDVAAGLRPVMDAANRAANLTRQLLTFSRQRVKQAQLLDLGEVVTGTAKLLRRVLGEQIALETQSLPTLPSVQADPGMMEQLLMNLVINARDAMPDGGRLAIAVDTAEVDEACAAAHPPARAGTHVRLQVRDNGCGIPPEHLPRIFEPFFTTKEVGKGTGLGLATVFGIAQQHNGWVEVESQVGRGSVFCVFLPAAPQASSALPAQRAAAVRGGSETILLVEDEPAVRVAAASALRRWGYRVLEAPTAAEALRRWEEENGRIDLLLTDIIMPGDMSGKQLAANLINRRPVLKVIYSSGYSSEVPLSELDTVGGGNFLPKPYPIEGLLSAVRARLDEP